MEFECKVTKYVYDVFAMYFPMIAKYTLEFNHIGLREYEAVCEGLSGEGARCIFIYDDLDKTLRHKPYMSSDELTSQGWATEFGYKLNRAMRLANFSQEELAKELGVSRVTINRYINGKHVPNNLIVKKIAKVLDCDVNVLINF